MDPIRLRCLGHLLIPVGLFCLVFVAGARLLHENGFILGRHVLGARGHFEAGFAASRHYLGHATAVDLVCTGDSRVGTGVNPAAIDALRCFNLSCGSQTISVTRGVILESLARENCRPRFLLIGVTPDYLSAAATNDADSQLVVQSYREKERWRVKAPVAQQVLQRYLPAVYYRDLVLKDLSAMSILLRRARPPRVAYTIPLTAPVTWAQYFRFISPRPERTRLVENTQSAILEEFRTDRTGRLLVNYLLPLA
jgi:hypothetical protein